ncbi:glycosyltransferase [Paenibacillus xanthanilyticus]|uniref:Glycosyltransferase n=1 Tax=Paenibacillus xanthanilyticus TaxID=1783531 RepID=A0ABV8K9B5_9BACL
MATNKPGKARVAGSGVAESGGSGRSPRYRVYWHGPLHRKGGLGGASKAYARALRRQGIPVRASSSRKVKRPIAADRGKRVLVYHYPPHTMNPARAKGLGYNKVVLNTVWETTRIPARWRQAMNRYDAVLVPSRHNLRAMQDSGVKVPVYVAPHGVNTRAYRPSNPPARLPGGRGRFVFLSVFGFQHRKNPEALLRAYWEEFTEADNVLLVIKTNGCGPGEDGTWIRSRISRYRASLSIPHRTAPLLLLTRHLDSRELKGLYTAAHAFVLPTRGEGVGMPFMEAMASGIPAVATAWGGQMDFLTPSNAFLVPYRLERPAVSMGKRSAISRSFREIFAEKDQLWAEADLGMLKMQMRRAYANPSLCREKGRLARRDMKALGWKAAGRAMASALDRVAAGAVSRREAPLADGTARKRQARKKTAVPNAVRAGRDRAGEPAQHRRPWMGSRFRQSPR